MHHGICVVAANTGALTLEELLNSDIVTNLPYIVAPQFRMDEYVLV
jgi:hypothetical protein